MVNYIVNHVEATLYEIEPLIAYPSDYNVTTKVAEQEKIENARPAIKNSIDISKYDFIFVGFPIWWHTAPMIIGTFLETYSQLYGLHIEQGLSDEEIDSILVLDIKPAAYFNNNNQHGGASEIAFDEKIMGWLFNR